MLTPAFHFAILKDFLAKMNNHATELRDRLMERVECPDAFNIFPCVSYTVLDLLCGKYQGSRYVSEIVVIMIPLAHTCRIEGAMGYREYLVTGRE